STCRSRPAEGRKPTMPDETLDIPAIRRDGRLDGKVAIVTGAGSAGAMGGTGADIAVLFALKGAKVVLVEIDRARAEHTLAAIRHLGGEAVPAIGDITRAADCRAMAATARD